MRRAAPLLIAVLIAAGCGGGATPRRAAPAPPPGGDAGVVRRWADTLRRGDVAGAARLFALPAVVQNDSPLLTLRTRRQVRLFNRSLPCGARLEASVPHHGYVLAVFRLTDRRGPGAIHHCPGVGHEAATAFRIVHGRIAEWRRVPPPGQAAPAAGSPA